MKARVLLFCAVLLPAIAAYSVLYRQAFPFPYQDDYHAVVRFASDFQSLPSWKQKTLAIATAQHNEYKLGFTHSVVALDLQLSRHLNFFFLAILGDLFLLPVAYLLWQTYGRVESDPALRLLAFLPISSLLFALTYWETIDWPMAGIQNISIVWFSLLTIYVLIPTKTVALSPTRLILACCAAALAAFTSANGFLLGPLGLLFLLPRRAYRAAALWCLSFVAPLAAYLYHYVPLPHPKHHYFYITRPLFFLAFLGGVIPFRWVAVLLGLGIVTLLGLALRSRFDRINPVACYFSLWVLATAALVAWVRGTAGVYVAYRYSIYSLMLLIFCYSFIAHRFATRSTTVRKWFYATVAIAAAAFCFAADVRADRKLADRRATVVAGMEHYCADPALNSPMIDPVVIKLLPTEADQERLDLNQGIQTGIVAPVCNQRPAKR